MSRQTVRCLAVVLTLAFAFASLPAFALGPAKMRQEHASHGWLFPSAWWFLESAWGWVVGLAVPSDPGPVKPPVAATGDVGAGTDPNG